MGELISLFEVVLLGVAGLAFTAFWIWALIDCVNNYRGDDRIVWVLVILFLHSLGALLYVLFARNTQRRRDWR